MGSVWGERVVTPYLVAITGCSGSGKTRLIEQVVPLLRKRGLKVGAIKHAHDRVDLDVPGKDSWRYLKAGADAVAVVGPRQLLLMRRTAAEGGLQEALKSLSAELELILLEGFHEAKVPQIAVADRAGALRHGRRVIAVVSRRPVNRRVRQFRPSQIKELAAFIEGEWMRQWEASQCRPSQGSSSAAV